MKRDRMSDDDTLEDCRYHLGANDQEDVPKMISSIRIKGYRTFTDFSVEGLSRINLFVGKNNTGKTSLLEALSLLWAGSDIATLWATLARRGEQPVPEILSGRPVVQEVDVSHLFTGHALKVGDEFSIRTTNERPDRTINYRVDEAKLDDSQPLFLQFAAAEPGGAALALRISGFRILDQSIPLTARGTLRNDTFQHAANQLRLGRIEEDYKPQFLTTSSSNLQELLASWNEITLKPEEDLVLRALKFIDARIERIAPSSTPFHFNNRGGFWLKRKDEGRVPIGSFGDGIWRLFALSVALARAKNSILLVDEIDTGLHYTVMESVWRFIAEISKTFNVQVFATTHSYDCIHSLARVCRDVDDAHSEMSVHRIEVGRNHSIPFSEAEIKIAAEREIEIR